MRLALSARDTVADIAAYLSANVRPDHLEWDLSRSQTATQRALARTPGRLVLFVDIEKSSLWDGPETVIPADYGEPTPSVPFAPPKVVIGWGRITGRPLRGWIEIESVDVDKEPDWHAIATLIGSFPEYLLKPIRSDESRAWTPEGAASLLRHDPAWCITNHLLWFSLDRWSGGREAV